MHGLGFLSGETLCGAAAARALCGGGPKARPVASGALCARGGGCADALSGLGFLSGETLCGAAAARALCGGGPKARPVASGALCARGGGCADALSGLGFLSGETLCGAAAARALCRGGGPKAAPWRLARRARGLKAAQMCCLAPLFVWRNSLRCRGGACAAALLIASRGRRGPRRGRRRTGARCRWRRPRCCRPCAPWRGSPGRQSASRRRARAPCSPRR